MIFAHILVALLGGLCVGLGLDATATGRLRAFIWLQWEEQRPSTARAIGVFLIGLGGFAIWRALVG